VTPPSMEQTRYQRMKELFFEALELPAAERESFVEEAPELDPELKAELRRLIEAHNGAETFLSRPAVNLGALSSGEGPLRFQPGMLLAGRFEIVRFISSGGMGEVYEAEDLELRDRVALKTIRLGIAGNLKVLELFKHEIQLARKVTHPNVCRIFDLELHVDPEGVEESVHFLSMELLDGQSLSEYLKENGPFTPDEAMPLIEQMASALKAAHDAGVIHRDFKPGNVLLVRREGEGELRAVVTDFGLALPSLSGPGPGGKRGGTPGYMPPEQLEGGTVTTASDVYSFGTVVAEMVGGRTAEERRTLLSTLFTASESHPGVLLQLPESCAGWREVLERCVERDPGQRFQKPAEVVEALKATDPRRARSRWHRWLPGAGGRAKADQLRPSLLRRWTWPVLVPAVGVLAMATSASRWWPVVPPPVVTGMVQLTSDGHPKTSALFTDGRRIYFSENVGGRMIAAGVPVEGGEPEEIPTPFLNPAVQDVSAQGTELLVVNGESGRVGKLWVVSTAGGKAHRVGDLEASEARWSPDGGRVLYIRGNDVYVAKSDGTQSRKLASMPTEPRFPSWSPDGRRISISMDGALWELDADGSNLHRRLPDWSGARSVRGHWTQDGKYFLFVTFVGGPDDSIYAVRERGSRFERWDKDPVRLTSGPIFPELAVPSRDGSRIFFPGNPGQRGHLSRYDAKSGEWHPFLSGISGEHLDYSSDRQWVVYTSIPQANLFRCRMDGSQQLQLTSPPLQVASPRWSPDGKRIVFMGRLPGKPWKIYLIPGYGGVLEPLLASGYTERYPQWLPDGNSLIFKRDVSTDEEPSKPPLVGIIDLRTKGITYIPGSWMAERPRLSPDGRYLAVTCVDKVMLYDFSTQRWEELARDGDFYFPEWSSDSQYFYFVDWIGDVYDRVRIRDRKLERVASITCGPIASGSLGGPWVGLAPDEAPLACLNETSWEIFALDWKAP
jgi:Tol biopolymer transport system component